MSTNKPKFVKKISLWQLKESYWFYPSKVMILLSTFVNCPNKRTTFSTRMKLKRMNPKMNSISWTISKKVKRKNKFKRLIMLISRKFWKRMLINFWVVALLVLLIQSNSLNKSLVDGLKTSNQSKDWWKSMKNKLKPYKRKSDF